MKLSTLLSSIISLATLAQAIPLSGSNTTWSDFEKRAPELGDTYPAQLARIGQTHLLQTATEDRLKQKNWKAFRDATWGKAVVVYVIDTGIRGTHNEFSLNTVAQGYTLDRLGGNFPANQDTADRDSENRPIGHGTGVAATIVGKTVGVAPAATIVPIRIFGEGNSKTELATTTDDVIWGINQAVADYTTKHSAFKAIINISYTIRSTPAAWDAIDKAIKAGMHVVYAAGNDNKDQCPLTSDRPKAADNTKRVWHPKQITVGGVGIVTGHEAVFYNSGRVRIHKLCDLDFVLTAYGV
ncbi:hypothetical protein PQX77_000956 [Marasmius sp. AFHP31]|nr:hypothetical protein PQX77_000956 [Marasmius sp. AFHP31]